MGSGKGSGMGSGIGSEIGSASGTELLTRSLAYIFLGQPIDEQPWP